ncbi:Predicted amidohydrolase [Pustulibacterium marinum]|uniref:Predicted amidohydrolase n=1 Tax=Pustulibacterium marinum TaxID=1224947 RepID=A0A1I7HMA1_9FLAO|nr:carbon-nitrogen hydrolase family protein [Pustulibacterium marinum]SFU61556.1 Predicted amidohydrolase [Pustulibacterium marinum]
MKIAIAQIKPKIGNVSSNTLKHLKQIMEAAVEEAQAIFFPELSLSGYDVKMAKSLAVELTDPIFDVFQHQSDDFQMTIAVGMPILEKKGVSISMVIFQPDSTRRRYAKQYLHDDEKPYFVAGNESILIEVEDNCKIVPAICYESLQADHLSAAVAQNASLYLASVAKSKEGVIKAAAIYEENASKYNIPIAMANCTGPCDTFTAGGNSGFWNEKGILQKKLNKMEEGILVFDIP